MRAPHRSIAVVLAVAALAAGGSGASGASSSTPWSRITGPNDGGDQLGLARTADGTLHVVWNRGTQSPSSIFDTRFSPNGRKAGTTTVTSRWDGSKSGLALLVMPDRTLRLFATGGHSDADSNGGMSTFTAPATGAGWTLEADVWGGPVASASGVIGATLTKDGQVVTGWRGIAAEGLPPSSIPQEPYAPFQLATHLATDATTGAVVLPDNSYNNDWITGLSARIGAPVYVAYADTKAVHLYRYGGGSKTLARGPYTSATVCPGPDGRLWVAWGDAANELFVTRSNRAAGRYEPVQKLTLPQQTTNGLRFLQCEGSAGQLDLFADVSDKANGLGFWHTHVLPELTLGARATHGKATLIATDAGDPVGGATIAVGGRHTRTAASGQVSLTLRPGSYTATVSAPGYAGATARFTVR